MKRAISLFVSLALLCSVILPTNTNFLAYAEENNIVEVVDYNLRRGLLEAINHKNGIVKPVEHPDIMNAVFTKNQLQELDRLGPEVCASHNNQEFTLKISDLSGIEYCTNLVNLSLVNQRITNITPLKNLVKLQKLDMRNNELNGVPITDISPIAGLVALEELNLSQSKITDVSHLSNLHKIKKLSLMGTKIDNIDFIKNMPDIEYVDLSLNKIFDISPLKDANKLTVLRLSANPNSIERKIEDISLLKNLTKLEELHIANHKLSDISVMTKFPYLKFVDLQGNNIDNFEPLFVLNNLSTVWVKGNKEGFDNSIESYKKAKLLFTKLNKDTLTREDIPVIEELLSSDANIKSFFSQSTIERLTEFKDRLSQVESIENNIFDYLKIEKVSGDIIEIDHFADLKIEQGKGLEEIKNLLPKSILVKIAKAQEEIKGKVEYDEQEAEILNIALVDKDGKLVKKELEFVSSLDNKILKSKDGFLKIRRSDLSLFSWVNTKFELKSDEFKLERDITVAKTATTRLRFFNDVNYDALSNSDFEKKLVVTILDKNGDNGGSNPEQPGQGDNGGSNPEQPGQGGNGGSNPEQPGQGDNGESNPENPATDENLGVKADRVYYRVVDTNGNKITTGISFRAQDADGFALDMVAESDGDYFVFKSDREEYVYTIKLISDNYQLSRTYKFETSYRELFKRFMVDDETKTVAEIQNDENGNRFFTIVVKALPIEESENTAFRTVPLYFVMLDNSETSLPNEYVQKAIGVSWDSNFEDKEGEYTLTGELMLEEGITNSQNLRPTIKVIVTKKQTENQGSAMDQGGNSNNTGNTGTGSTGGSGGLYGGNSTGGNSNSKENDSKATYTANAPVIENKNLLIEKLDRVVIKANADLKKIKKGESEAFIRDGKLMLQLKYLVNVLGINIQWNQKDKKAELTIDGTKAYIFAKESKFLINNKKENAKVEIINGRVYISISDISKALNMTKQKTMVWNNNTKELEIVK